MINKFEAVGIFASIGLMAVALFLLRIEQAPTLVQNKNEAPAQVATVVAGGDVENTTNIQKTITKALREDGSLQKLIIDDVVLGTGREAQVGDTVTVDYIGTLQNGQEFDNSKKRGTPFTFTLGENRVIAGWEQGVLGMKVGGERILVIPPQLAYGNKNVGPIPANSTLVFAISLLSIE